MVECAPFSGHSGAIVGRFGSIVVVGDLLLLLEELEAVHGNYLAHKDSERAWDLSTEELRAQNDLFVGAAFPEF